MGRSAPQEAGGASPHPAQEAQSDGPWGQGRGALVHQQKKSDIKAAIAIAQAQKTKRDIVHAVDLIGWHKLADKLKDCGFKVYTFRCRDCGHQWEAPQRCHHRLCPDCASARAARLFDRHSVLMGRKNLKHAVFTLLSVPDITPEYVRGLISAFNKLRKRRLYRNSWHGGVRSVEFTYTPDSYYEFDTRRRRYFRKAQGWHVHIHVLIDGKYIPQKVIAAHWAQVTGGRGLVVWIERAKNPRQALKYILKPGEEILDDPKALDDFISTIEGLHLVSGFGAFWRIRGERTDVLGRECPMCASRNISYEGFKYAFWDVSPGVVGDTPTRDPPVNYQPELVSPLQGRML